MEKSLRPMNRYFKMKKRSVKQVLEGDRYLLEGER
jgi:hypothetical protein